MRQGGPPAKGSHTPLPPLLKPYPSMVPLKSSITIMVAAGCAAQAPSGLTHRKPPMGPNDTSALLPAAGVCSCYGGPLKPHICMYRAASSLDGNKVC